jgi:polar amino acid transport system ATP-binding protein/sulfate transport system ATP-binding protein
MGGVEMNGIPYTENEPLLRVENISLQINGNEILRDVNATIKNIRRDGVTQGQVVGFLGMSGYGKTKLFEILSGLRKPTSGQVLLGDPGVPVHSGMVGVVPQNYPLFRWRTVLGNLMIASQQAGNSQKVAKERSMEMLETFKLTDKANFYPKELSGGQRQRIAIARQILCDGDILLMDEPFSGLDLKMKIELAKLINKISLMGEKKTIIVVTHVIEEAASVADELWLLARDRDEKGNEIPGSRINHTYDLKKEGLAWHPDIRDMPEFWDFVREVERKFISL